jgi:hypothetical protein
LSPSANSSTVEFMAKTKFQVKQWQALNEKHNEIWNKKSTVAISHVTSRTFQ